jgi:hypothetical protein
MLLLLVFIVLAIMLAPGVEAVAKATKAEHERSMQPQPVALPQTDAAQCLCQLAEAKGGPKVGELAASYDALHVQSRRMFVFADGSTIQYKRGQWSEGGATCAQMLLRVLWLAGNLRVHTALPAALQEPAFTAMYGDLSCLPVSSTPDWLEIVELPDGSRAGFNCNSGFWEEI